MSDFSTLLDALKAELIVALPAGAEVRVGFIQPSEVVPKAVAPFAMVYNPTEVAEDLTAGQRLLTVTTLVVLIGAPDDVQNATADTSQALLNMSGWLDDIRDQLERTWTSLPLGGVVDTLLVSERAVDETLDTARTYGLMSVTTTEEVGG